MKLINDRLLILYFHILCLEVIKLPMATIGIEHLGTFLLFFKFNLKWTTNKCKYILAIKISLLLCLF